MIATSTVLKLLVSISALLIAYVVHKVIMKSVDKFMSTLGKELKAPKTLSLLLAFLIYGFAVAGILAVWDVNLTPYLTGLGISGVVLGLAFQEPLTNFLSGLMVLVTRKVFEGEVVDIEGQTGVVDVIKMNHTHILTFDGKLVLIPNRKVWSGTITKFWPGKYRRVDVNIAVDYSSDMSFVIDLLRKVLEEEPLVVKDSSLTNIVLFNSFDSNGVTLSVKFWVEKDTYFDAINAVALRIKKTFDAYGVRIPNNVVEVKINSSEGKI